MRMDTILRETRILRVAPGGRESRSPHGPGLSPHHEENNMKATTPKFVRILYGFWRIYADPAKSEAAKALKVLIPLEIASFAYRMWAPEEWPRLAGTNLMQIFLWYALLWFVRQRDEARAQLKVERQKERT
jgi:hypothetical protein